MRTIINHTNRSLANWYVNAKADFGLEGNGNCTFDAVTNEFVINYTEDGVNCIWKHKMQEGYQIDTIFNIWMESASVEKDKKI